MVRSPSVTSLTLEPGFKPSDYPISTEGTPLPIRDCRVEESKSCTLYLSSCKILSVFYPSSFSEDPNILISRHDFIGTRLALKPRVSKLFEMGSPGRGNRAT